MLRKLLRAKDGNFAAITALLLAPLIAAAALVLNATAAYLEATKLQEGLDAAALGSLRTFADTQSVPKAVDAAKGLFGVSFESQFATPLLEVDGTFKVDLDVVSSSLEERAVASSTVEFTPSLLPWGSFGIYRESIAIRSKPMEICILALHPSKARSFTVSGNTNVDLTGCTAVANSGSGQAIYVAGSAQFKGKCLVSHGGVSLSQPVSLACGAPRTNAPAVADPYANKQLPKAAAVATPLPFGAVVAVIPGTYKDVVINGDAVLAPGNYIIDGGQLKLTAQANVVGKGVTFFLLNDAELDIHGSATVNLSASRYGPWAGFLFVADRENANRVVINGNSNSSMTGIFYLPRAQELHFSGGGTTQGGCVRLIAQEITLIGNSKFSIDCSNKLNGTVLQTEGGIRLAQ
jgi:hypothetical protein